MTRGTRSLELGEDPSFQRRSWRVQQIGWIVMLLVLAAGMLGLLGGAGPLVSGTSGNAASGIVIDYPRFLRNRSPVDLEITVMAGATSSNEVSIAIDRDYLEWFDIQYINPEPSEVEAGDSTLTYTFQLSDPDQETGVMFNMQPEHYGFAEGRVSIEGMPDVEFWQIVYP